MILRWSPLVLMIVFVVNACTSSPKNDGKTYPKAHVVEIKQMAFSPQEITVNKGDTIIFSNHDLVDHDVTEEDKKLWSSSPLHPGQTWSKVVNESANYFCSLHVVMKGKIIVQ